MSTFYPSKEGKNVPSGNSEIIRAAIPTTGPRNRVGSSLASKCGSTSSVSAGKGVPTQCPSWGHLHREPRGWCVLTVHRRQSCRGQTALPVAWRAENQTKRESSLALRFSGICLAKFYPYLGSFTPFFLLTFPFWG